MKMKNNYSPIKLLILFSFLFVIGTIPDDQYHAFALSGIAIKKPAKISAVKRKAKTTKDISNLDEALKAGVPVVVKLGSDRCLPCRMMNPIMKELAVEQDGKAVFLNLDIYENRELARQVGARLIPTILFYDRKEKLKAKSDEGMTKEQILETIKELELRK